MGMLGFNKKQLQTIAIIAMVCDHVAWGFVDFFTVEGQIMHLIGRLTLPIMCFFIAEGYRHTTNLARYIYRMIVFAAITTVPFYLFFHNLYDFRQNIIFDLTLGLLLLTVLEHKEYSKVKKIIYSTLLVGTSLIIGGWVVMPMVYILIFYYGKDFKTQAKYFCIATVTLVLGLTVTICLNNVYHFMHYSWVWYDKLYLLGFMFALIPLSRYNHQKGNYKGMSLFFYGFYPAHFIVLYIIQQIVWNKGFQELYVSSQLMTIICTLILITITALATPSRPQISCLVTEVFTLIYCIGYWIEITSTNLEVCAWAVRLQYFGEVFLLIGITWFMAEFCHYRLSKAIYVAQYLIGIVFLIIINTFQKHSLFYRSFTIDYSGPFPRLSIEYGVFFYIFVLYMALVCVLIFYICIKQLKHSQGLERKRVKCIIAGTLCPWIATLIRMLGLSGGYEISSFGAFFAIVFLAMALVECGYFNSVQLAMDNALNHGTAGIMVYDLQGCILYYNKVMKKIIPQIDISIDVKKITELSNIIDGHSQKLDVAHETYEIRIEPLVEMNYTQGYMLWAINMTKHYKNLEDVTRLARTDDLTGMNSRNFFQAQVVEYLSNKKEGSFFILDLDNFKGVNDTLGHQTGDKVLLLFAGIIQEVAKEHYTCRIGGDEFCIFFKEIVLDEDLIKMAKKIIERFANEINDITKKEVNTSVSIGVSKCNYDMLTQYTDDYEKIYQSLYLRADKALYLSKNSGKGTYRFYESETR